MIRLKDLKWPPADRLALLLKAHKIPFTREFPFDPERKYRADFLLTGTHILLECEGGIWTGGRHVRGAGFTADIKKYEAARARGYTVIRCVPDAIDAGDVIGWIRNALKLRRAS